MRRKNSRPFAPSCGQNTGIIGVMLYLEFDIVAYEDISFHKLLLIISVLCDDREGVIDCGPQDADQRLNTGVRIHICQVGLHDVTGCQSNVEMERQQKQRRQNCTRLSFIHALMDK